MKGRANPVEGKMKGHMQPYCLIAQFKNINERRVEYILNERRENTHAKGVSCGDGVGGWMRERKRG